MDQISSHLLLQLMPGHDINCWRHTARGGTGRPVARRKDNTRVFNIFPVVAHSWHFPVWAWLKNKPNKFSFPTSLLFFYLQPSTSDCKCFDLNFYMAWYVTQRSLGHTPQTLSDKGVNSSVWFPHCLSSQRCWILEWVAPPRTSLLEVSIGDFCQI